MVLSLLSEKNIDNNNVIPKAYVYHSLGQRTTNQTERGDWPEAGDPSLRK